MSKQFERLYHAWVLDFRDRYLRWANPAARPWEPSCRKCDGTCKTQDNLMVLCDHCDAMYGISCKLHAYIFLKSACYSISNNNFGFIFLWPRSQTKAQESTKRSMALPFMCTKSKKELISQHTLRCDGAGGKEKGRDWRCSQEASGEFS